MPIPSEDLRKDFVLAMPDTTIGELLRKLPKKRQERAFWYIVLPVVGGRYIVAQWVEVERIAAQLPGEAGGLRFADLSGLPEPVAAVEQVSMGVKAARAERDKQPGRRLVALANGVVVGLLVFRDLKGDDLPFDPFGSRPISAPTPMNPKMDDAELAEPEAVVLSDITEEKTAKAIPESAPGVLSDTAGDQPAKAAAADTRVINAWLADHDKDEPLQLGQTYELKFNVDAPRADARATSAFDPTKLFSSLPPDQKTVDITVVIESDDVAIIGNDQAVLTVPRAGKSKNNATFTIEPKKNGPASLKVMFIANNRVFQKMTITLQVGPKLTEAPAMSAVVSGLTMGSVMARPARDTEQTVNLMIIKKEAGYQFILQCAGVTRAFINLSEDAVAELILRAREDLKAIVYTLVNNQYVYQGDESNIPADVHAASLKTLAKLGYYLYQKIFFSPGNGPDARAMGDLLRQISQQRQLHIEIAAERFIFPWSLLYDRHPLDLNKIDPEGFWGFKHVIEYTPEFNAATPVNFIPEITVGDTLNVAFICNTTIDTQFKRPIVAGQLEFLQQLAGVSVTKHANMQDLFDLLNNPDTPAQILYIYAHAVGNLPGEKGGVSASKVILSDGAIQLGDFDVFAPITGQVLKQAPLVYMNCCQSAELSPYLYDGLVPYLIAKGARGVIGTEVDTPALFAAEFAKEFLSRFTAGGQTLGELLLDLRRKYLIDKNNVMGLVYACYSSGEVVVQRGG